MSDKITFTLIGTVFMLSLSAYAITKILEDMDYQLVGLNARLEGVESQLTKSKKTTPKETVKDDA
jgi:hypothetical protein